MSAGPHGVEHVGAIVAVNAGRLCVVACSEVEVAVAIVVAPAETIGRFLLRGGPCGVEHAATIVAVHAVRLSVVEAVAVALSEIEVAVAVVVAPTDAWGRVILHGGPHGGEDAPAIVAVHAVRLILVTRCEVEVAVAVVVAPTDALGVVRLRRGPRGGQARYLRHRCGTRTSSNYGLRRGRGRRRRRSRPN